MLNSFWRSSVSVQPFRLAEPGPHGSTGMNGIYAIRRRAWYEISHPISTPPLPMKIMTCTCHRAHTALEGGRSRTDTFCCITKMTLCKWKHGTDSLYEY